MTSFRHVGGRIAIVRGDADQLTAVGRGRAPGQGGRQRHIWGPGRRQLIFGGSVALDCMAFE